MCYAVIADEGLSRLTTVDPVGLVDSVDGEVTEVGRTVAIGLFGATEGLIIANRCCCSHCVPGSERAFRLARLPPGLDSMGFRTKLKLPGKQVFGVSRITSCGCAAAT